MAIGYMDDNHKIVMGVIEAAYLKYFRQLEVMDILDAWGTTNHPEEVV